MSQPPHAALEPPQCFFFIDSFHLDAQTRRRLQFFTSSPVSALIYRQLYSPKMNLVILKCTLISTLLLMSYWLWDKLIKPWNAYPRSMCEQIVSQLTENFLGLKFWVCILQQAHVQKNKISKPWVIKTWALDIQFYIFNSYFSQIPKN